LNYSRARALVLTSVLLAVAPSAAAGQDAPSEETIAFFKQNCVSCHTIGGGKLVGPDLKGVTDRREADWLADFIRDPKAVIDSGDPYAVQIFQEAGGVYMTQVPGIDRTLADKLVALIAAESLLEESQFLGLQISDRPLTDLDVARGERLFLGTDAYLNGAPPCASCHTVAELGGLGGGRLGPDLTSAYARLEGRKALAAWLSSPPSAVMQPVFADHPLDGEEILALVAFLADSAASGSAEAPSGILTFLLLGFGGAAVLLLAFDFLWRRRFRAVRRPLVRRLRPRTSAGGPA
jgi:mono/diheme cytochrome c family protein